MTDPKVAALVRAIRRAHAGEQYGGVVEFHVRDVFAFAERLVAAGVTAREPRQRKDRAA